MAAKTEPEKGTGVWQLCSHLLTPENRMLHERTVNTRIPRSISSKRHATYVTETGSNEAAKPRPDYAHQTQKVIPRHRARHGDWQHTKRDLDSADWRGWWRVCCEYISAITQLAMMDFQAQLLHTYSRTPGATVETVFGLVDTTVNIY